MIWYPSINNQEVTKEGEGVYISREYQIFTSISSGFWNVRGQCYRTHSCSSPRGGVLGDGSLGDFLVRMPLGLEIGCGICGDSLPRLRLRELEDDDPTLSDSELDSV